MTWSNNLHAFDAFQIHWLSIINSVVLVFLLIGFVVIILVNTCRSLWYCWLVHVLIERILHGCAKIWNVFWIVNDIWNKSYMNCGNEMKMKKWSSQWTQFMQLHKEAWKKFRTIFSTWGTQFNWGFTSKQL